MVELLPVRERLGVTVQVAAQFSGFSVARIYELLAAGVLDGKIIQGRKIVLVASLVKLVDGLEDA
jgi:hypothetical protein